MSNEVEKKQMSIAEYVGKEAVSGNIQQVLKEKTAQFIASVTSLVNANEALREADNKSILLACLTASSLDLPINQNLGFAYIIPYKNNSKEVSRDENGKEVVVWKQQTVAQFQMGYKGFVQLAMRSGQFKTINVTEVKEGEIISNNLLTGEIKFEWAPDRDGKKTVGYVAFMQLINGFEKMLYMTNEQLKAHGVKFSKSFKFGGGLWKDDFDSMAKKTVLKLLLSKYAPMTIDMQKAQEADQAIVKDDGYEYPDNDSRVPVDHEEVSDQKEKERVIKHINGAKTIKVLEECKEALTEETKELYNEKLTKLMEELKNAKS